MGGLLCGFAAYWALIFAPMIVPPQMTLAIWCSWPGITAPLATTDNATTTVETSGPTARSRCRQWNFDENSTAWSKVSTACRNGRRGLLRGHSLASLTSSEISIANCFGSEVPPL
jgi:hypothetical protein